MRAVGAAARAGRFPLAVTFAVSVALSFSPMLGLLLSALGAVALAGWVLFMVGRVVAAAWCRAWRRSVLALLVLVGVWPFAAGLFLSGDYVHLALMYPFYASRISAAAAQPGQAHFDWGGTGWGGIASSDRSLVYDATGQLAREIGLRPSPGGDGVWIGTTHLVGRFYVVVLSFGAAEALPASQGDPGSRPGPYRPPEVRLHPDRS